MESLGGSSHGYVGIAWDEKPCSALHVGFIGKTAKAVYLEKMYIPFKWI